jgi:hypothetical protein
MKRLVVTVMVSTLVLMLLPSIPPAQAASGEAAVSGEAPTFHALSRMPDEAYRSLTPLTNDELDSVTGAAPLNLNLGLVLQINVCAICRGVTQTNIGVLLQNISRMRALR